MLCSFIHISFESLMNRILGLTRIFPRPVRDDMWAEKRKRPNTHRAVRPACPAGRYGIWRNHDIATNHIAYLTARDSIFTIYGYRYIVPNGTNTISDIP